VPEPRYESARLAYADAGRWGVALGLESQLDCDRVGVGAKQILPYRIPASVAPGIPGGCKAGCSAGWKRAAVGQVCAAWRCRNSWVRWLKSSTFS
jgi:hypothetical protein